MCCCFSFRASCSAVVPEIFLAYLDDVSVNCQREKTKMSKPHQILYDDLSHFKDNFSENEYRCSHQARAAGSAPHTGGHRADGADGGAGGAVSQRRHAHRHTFALLSFSWTGGREANADHFVDRSKEAKLGWTLEISIGRE